MVDVLYTGKLNPEQALLTVQNETDVEAIAIVYSVKGEGHCRLTCSTMPPSEAYFMGGSLQHFALNQMKE